MLDDAFREFDFGAERPEEAAMSGAQREILLRLCKRAAVAFDGTLTQAAADRRIDELQRLGWSGVGSGGTSPA